MENRTGQDHAHWIEDVMKRFCSRSPDNSLLNGTGEKAWAAPLMGFSRGDDPLYTQIKEDIGPFYWTPLEVFQHHFPQAGAFPENLAVIAWILPQTGETRRDHRKETAFPSERWVRSRLHGEAFNSTLRLHLMNTLLDAGFQAVAPVASPLWSREISPRYGFASRWSERHAAHVCGLGTFGLCDGLITAAGKAVRCGSVVARIPIEPTPRPYTHHRAYCLFFSHGTCGKCMRRCPVGAISQRGHDKAGCREYIRQVTSPYAEDRFGMRANACGLCQTRVPCESRIPGR